MSFVIWEVWDGDLFVTYAYTLEEAHAYWEAGYEVIPMEQDDE